MDISGFARFQRVGNEVAYSVDFRPVKRAGALDRKLRLQRCRWIFLRDDRTEAVPGIRVRLRPDRFGITRPFHDPFDQTEQASIAFGRFFHVCIQYQR